MQREGRREEIMFGVVITKVGIGDVKQGSSCSRCDKVGLAYRHCRFPVNRN